MKLHENLSLDLRTISDRNYKAAAAGIARRCTPQQLRSLYDRWSKQYATRNLGNTSCLGTGFFLVELQRRLEEVE